VPLLLHEEISLIFGANCMTKIEQLDKYAAGVSASIILAIFVVFFAGNFREPIHEWAETAQYASILSYAFKFPLLGFLSVIAGVLLIIGADALVKRESMIGCACLTVVSLALSLLSIAVVFSLDAIGVAYLVPFLGAVVCISLALSCVVSFLKINNIVVVTDQFMRLKFSYLIFIVTLLATILHFSFFGYSGIFYILGYVTFASLTSFVAGLKNKDTDAWFMYGALLGVVALGIVVFARAKPAGN
jgi:hypothetical protein